MPAARTTSSKAVTPAEWLGGVDAGEHGLRALCGYWLDQKGSTYHLQPGGAHSLHVHTARPSGHQRYTAHLVRLLGARGDKPRVVWGANRYTLRDNGQDSITWWGRDFDDHFSWGRVA